MSDVVVKTRFRIRRDTAANWSANNPTPLEGEPCLETDTGFRKTGDGVTPWNSLQYDDASRVPFDSNSSNGLDSATVQEAIDELAARPSGGGSGSSAWSTVSKEADQTRTTTTTLADDSDLTVSLAAGKYAIRLLVQYSIANATMDFKYALNYTGTVTSAFGMQRLLQAGSAGGAGSQTEQILSALPSSSMTSSASGTGYLEVMLFIDLATSGTLSFQWAQNTSDAGACKVLAGSYLEYMAAGASGGGGYEEGDTFPSSPADGRKFYRNDLNLLCYYDGTQWLTVQEYEAGSGYYDRVGSGGNTTDSTITVRLPVRSDFRMFITRWVVYTRVFTTNNSTNYWNVSLAGQAADASSLTITGAAFTTQGDAINTLVSHDCAINAPLDASALGMFVFMSKHNAPGGIMPVSAVYYRLIVT
jgi:hypothetical protein